MEVEKSKIKVLVNSAHGEDSFWLSDGHLFAVSTHGGERESASTLA